MDHYKDIFQRYFPKIVGSVSFIILSFTFRTLIYLELVLRLSVLIVNIPCSSVSYSFQKISKLYYQVHVLHILVLLFLHHYVMLLSDPCDLIFFFLIFETFIGVQLIYSVMLVPGTQQSESFMHILF